MAAELSEFILSENAERGWSIRELARRANLSHVAVANFLAGKQKAGLAFCLKIAQAYQVPPERVFRAAGILPPVVIGGNEKRAEVMDTLQYLTDDDLNTIVAVVRVLYEHSRGEK